MPLFGIGLAVWTSIRLAGNVSRWYWTPERMAEIEKVEAILRKEGKGGLAEFIRKDMRNQRWIQGQAYNSAIEMASAIAGSVVGLRGLQLGVPLVTRIARVVGTRTLIRRWDLFGQSIWRLFTVPEEEIAAEIDDNLGLVAEGQGLVFEGMGIATDAWAMAHGSPISLLRIQSMGARVLGLADGIMDFWSKVEGAVEPLLPEKEPPRQARPFNWREQLDIYGAHFMEFTDPSLPPVVTAEPRPPPPVVPPPIDAIDTGRPAERLDKALRMRWRIQVPELLEILREIKKGR